MSWSRVAAVGALTVALLAPAGAGSAQTSAPERSGGTRVLAISVDGLNPSAIRRLGRAGTPVLHRLLTRGTSTLNARTEREQTVTLPNHTSMLTGRRIDAARGGHGVTWDVERPHATVQRAAGHRVASIFTTVHAAGGSTALFSTKPKFDLYERSWPRAIDRFTTDELQRRLVGRARRDLVRADRGFTFLHVSLPDRAGHAYGGMSRPYLRAVRRTDTLLGTVVRAIRSHRDLRRHVVVILTADHGFARGTHDHSGARRPGNYRIPFLVWGAGVRAGNLYARNPDYAAPGRRRTTYGGRQPVRNGDVANLATSLLGLGAVPGSGIGHAHRLDVR